MAEQSYILHVRCGDGALGSVPVLVTRKRVKNLNLRVRRDNTVVASVPWRCSQARTQEFLDAHAEWIASALSRRAIRDAVRDTGADDAGQGGGASDGSMDGYALWGREVRCEDGHTISAAELDRLRHRELEQALPQVVERMEPLVGARATSWQLRAMSSRWGSCTPTRGSIRINVRLAAYPPACLEYVVAHELAHLIEPSHNARFHAVVARAIPDEAQVRARLRQPPLGR